MRHREFLEKILYSTLFVTLFSIQLKITKVPFALDLLTRVENGGETTTRARSTPPCPQLYFHFDVSSPAGAFLMM